MASVPALGIRYRKIEKTTVSLPKATRTKERRKRGPRKSGHSSGLYEAATDSIVHAHAALRRGLLDVVILNLYVSQVTWCVKRSAIARRALSGD